MSACARAFQKWSRLCDATLARASDVRIAPISKQVRSSMSRFLPSPAGTKRALTNKVLREIFDHWNEIEEKTGKTRGQMTLTHLFRSEPGKLCSADRIIVAEGCLSRDRRWRDGRGPDRRCHRARSGKIIRCPSPRSPIRWMA